MYEIDALPRAGAGAVKMFYSSVSLYDANQSPNGPCNAGKLHGLRSSPPGQPDTSTALRDLSVVLPV